MHSYLRMAGLAAVFFTGLASAAAAQQSTPKWVINGEGTRCTLFRVLAEGPPRASLVFRSYPGQDSAEFMLALDPWGRTFGPEDQMTLSLSPSGEVVKRRPVTLPLAKGAGKALSTTGVPGSFLEAFGKAKTLSVAVNGKEVASYPIPAEASVAVEALRECKNEKLVEWGADPAGFEPGATPPKPVGEAKAWITYDDLHLPRHFGPGLFSANIIARLGIAPDGQVDKCGLIASNGEKRLESIACPLLLKRARYEPARAKDGHPVRSVMTYSTGWTVVDTITTTVW